MTVFQGDVVRVTAKMSFGSGDCQNTFWGFNAGADETDINVWTGIAAEIDDAYDTYDGVLTTSLKFDSIQVWNDTRHQPVGEAAWPTLVQGAISGDNAPLQLAPLVLFGTMTAKSQGRKYLPAPAMSGVDDFGQLASGVYNAAVLWAYKFLTPATAGSASIVWGNFNLTTFVFSPYISLLVSDIFRTQRRRVQGVGS
jgi:hypothetical protein